MATVNTAFGVLPSPKTQLLGGNAGGGVGSAALQQPPQQPRQQQPQQQFAPGAMPTFAQLQQQGQARPAPQQPMQEGAAPAPQPQMLSQLQSQLGGTGTAFAAPQQTIQQRVRQQSLQATPQNVALAIAQKDFADFAQAPRFVPGTNIRITPGTVVSSGDGQLIVDMGNGVTRPYTDADREAEVMDLAARGELQGLPEYEMRQKLMATANVDPAYAGVLATVRGMLSNAQTQAQQMRQQAAPTSAEAFQAELINQLKGFGAGGAGETPEMRQMRAARTADIQAQFGAQASALDEEMARRGLYASSIGAGRFGDLAGQQARAIATMEADLQLQAQKEAAENKRFYLQQMMGLSQQMVGKETELAKLQLQGKQVESDIDYRAKQLQQEAALQGRTLDLQSARDLVAKESRDMEYFLDRSRLSLEQNKLDADVNFRAKQLQQEAALQGRTLNLQEARDLAGVQIQKEQIAIEKSKVGLQEKQIDAEIEYRAKQLQQESLLQGRSMDLQEARDLATVEYQRGQLKQGDAEIDLRSKQLQQQAELEGRTLDIQSARDQASAEYQRGQLAQAAAETASRERLQQEQLQAQAKESAAERALREALQTRELTSAEKRQLLEIEANKAQQQAGFTFQAGQSQLERNLRETMQTRELTAEEKRQLTAIEAEKATAIQRQGFEAGQSQLERDLRTKMQTTELTAAEKRQLLEIEANKAQQERQFGFQKGESQLERDLRTTLQSREQAFQGAQTKLERDLREAAQMSETTGNQYRVVDGRIIPVLGPDGRPVKTSAVTQAEAERQSRVDLQNSQQTFQTQQNALDRNMREAAQMSETTGFQYRVVNGQIVPVLGADGKPIKTSAVSQAEAERQSRADLQTSQQTFQTEQSKLDRDLRALLSKNELDSAQKQFEAKFGFEKGQAANAFLAQLATILAPMDPTKRDAFLRTIGLDPKKLGINQPASGVNMPGAGGQGSTEQS